MNKRLNEYLEKKGAKALDEEAIRGLILDCSENRTGV